MKSPARVAHVIHHLGAGGAERRLLSILAGLDRSRFEPSLVCIDELGELVADARALGIEPTLLGRPHRRDPRGLARLAALMRRERIDIVHGWLSLANVYSRVAGVAARVPVRIAAEGGAVTTRDPRRAARDRVVDRVLDPLTHAYVANSEAVAESLRIRGLPAAKIAVIRNGVALRPPLGEAERGRIRASLGAGAQDVLIGMVARLDEGFKDHRTFLAAFADLVDEGRPVRAAIVGDGDARLRLEADAASLGIADRVAFTGYRPDAADILAAFDVSILLSYSEGFSNVVLETMAAGVPFVGTRIAPIEEAVVDGTHGLLVAVGDRPGTAAALRRIVDDPVAAAALGATARTRAREQYSLEAQAQATMDLYDRLLAQR